MGASARMRYMLWRLENRSHSLASLQCPAPTQPHAATPSLEQHKPLSVGVIIRRTETSVNPSKSQVAFTVRRQITAYFNASQGSLQCLCGNWAVLTHYLRRLGHLTRASAHTEPGLTQGMCQRLDRQRKLSGRSQEMAAVRNAAAAKD